MKLAEALQIRADTQRKIEELKNRLSNNATVQEGELPSEEPQELLQELDGALGQLEELITRINLTNAKKTRDGRSMTALLSRRDCLKLHLSAYRNFLYEAGQLSVRARGSEIKIKSTVSIPTLQKTIDQKAKELRELELTIQELNWKTELM